MLVPPGMKTRIGFSFRVVEFRNRLKNYPNRYGNCLEPGSYVMYLLAYPLYCAVGAQG
jgi:hypothetical protein